MNIYLMTETGWKYFENVAKEELNKRNIIVGEMASIGERARIGAEASIGAGASIGEGARIGKWARIGAGASIGEGARIGEEASIGVGASIGEMASIGEGARIGKWARIGAGASIGEEARIGEEASIGAQYTYLIIQNLGSRNAPMTAYKHEDSIMIGTGCYLGWIDEFEKNVKEKHGDNEHGKAYMAALEYVRKVLK